MSRTFPPRRRPFRPVVERLEDRTLPSTDVFHLGHLRTLLNHGDFSRLADHGRLQATEARLIPEQATAPQTSQVKALFRHYLHQQPTAAELKKALRSLKQGGTIEQLEAQILGSATYFRKRARGTNDRFLSVAAQDALGHPIDAATFQQLRQMLISGTPRTVVAALILQGRAPVPIPVPSPVPDTQAPQVVILTPGPGLQSHANVTFTGRVTDDRSGVASLQAQTDSGAFVDVAFDASGGFGFRTTLPLDGTAEGSHTIRLRAIDRAGNVSTFVGTSFTLDSLNPAAGTAPLNMTEATTMATAAEFLYTGTDPMQTGVAPGTIAPTRVAVLRGKVTDRAGAPLFGVAVTILGHPEFGSTRTRGDGMFDMAVNGGGLLTVAYTRNGFLPVQRQVDVPWQDYAWLPDVVLIPADAQVTTVDLTAATPVQVARGSSMTDADSTRQATLLFSQGTQATMVLPGGGTQPLTTLHVRATEYTLGPSGPAAMPGQLPANSGYTYAVELSADEAVAAGATEVSFSQPVAFYVENFLDFPIGGIVPAGYYDRARALWVASDNGCIVRIVSETGGRADLDIDGDGTADDPTVLGVTDAERERLAVLYDPNQELWRVPMTHFTPWDCNWPYGPPPDATPPGQPSPQPPVQPNPDQQCGSIIDVQNQVLGEVIGVTSTPFTLNYRSDRTSGYLPSRTLDISLSGASVPASLRRIELEITVAGRMFHQTFAPAPNQRFTFTWDGKDAYGRTVQGTQPYTYRIGYVYGAVYLEPAALQQAFAVFSGGGPGGTQVSLGAGRQSVEVIAWQEGAGTLGTLDARGQDGLGAWTLDVHHAYDLVSHELYLGNGGRRSGRSVRGEIETVSPIRTSGFEVAPDGSLYVAFGEVVRRVSPDGVITTVAGGGTSEYDEGIPATQAKLADIEEVALGPDGSLYISETRHHRISRVGLDGIIHFVAGQTFFAGFSGDGGPATQAQLNSPLGIDVAPDGSLYIADANNYRIRRVGPDGIITTVAGDGQSGFSGDGGAAAQSRLGFTYDVTVGPDGGLYIADPFNSRVRRIGPDGIITTVAGNGSPYFSGDGGPATQAGVGPVSSVAFGPDGSLFLNGAGARVRHIGPDGIITTVAGNGSTNSSGDGGPALKAGMLPGYIAVGADGRLYIADSTRVRRVEPPLPGDTGIDFVIPSEDGAELYGFDKNGRHLGTVNALTGAALYTFGYDAAGRLIRVEDDDGNVTTIERDANGVARAIVAPFGQRTTLEVNADGYLRRVANPADEAVQMTYFPGGLLETLTDPSDDVHRFRYDDRGRLSRDENPAGGFKTLDRTELADGFAVTVTTAEGMESTYRVENLPAGGVRRTNTMAGVSTTETIGLDGTRTITDPDGTVTVAVEGPDPRWGMQAQLITSLTTTTPANVRYTLTASRAVTLADPANILSLQTLTDTVTINGDTYTTTFDAAARTVTEGSPAGRQAVTTIDAQGRVLGQEVTGLASTHFQYDARGRLDSFGQGTGAAAREYTLAYDPQTGLLESVTDPLTGVETFGYDLAGQVIRDTLPGAREIGLGYDDNGNVTSVTPPGQPDHLIGYTPSDLEESYTPPAVSPGNSATGYKYNLDGQLTRITRPDGVTVDVGYDMATGRLATVTLPLGQLRYDYNAVTGHLMTITAPDGGTLTYAHDGFLPTRTTWAGALSGNVSQTYNSDFQVATQSVNGGSTVTFQYDRDGLLTRAGALTLTPDPDNGLLRGTTLGSLSTTRDYNEFGEVASDSASFNGTVLYATQYGSYDKLGRLQEKTETIGGVTVTFNYEYDAAGRLWKVRQNGTLVGIYTYDDNGNRLSHTSTTGTVNGSYDAQDRLTQYGDATYTYKANGELQSKTASGQTTTFDTDELGNLRSVTLPDGTHIDYVIDGQNRRIGKRVNGTLVRGLLYEDQLRPVAELDGSNNVVSRFVYATRDNVPDYMVRGGVTYRILTDHLGSVRLVVNVATGAVAQQLDYDEFGNVILDTNPGFQPFGFAGGLYDAQTKLTRFGARDYDAKTGRWTSKDPIRYSGGDANLYAYVSNDPVNRIDPLGLEWYFVGFPTAALAAQFALTEIYQQAKNEGVEYGGLIYRNSDGTYSFTKPRTDNDPMTVDPWVEQCPGKVVAFYHTHPKGNNFSPADRDYADFHRIDAYVATPQGDLKKYDPFSGGVFTEGRKVF